MYQLERYQYMYTNVTLVGVDGAINIQVTVLYLSSAQCVQRTFAFILARIHRGSPKRSVLTGRGDRCRGGGALRQGVGKDTTPQRDPEDLTCLPTLSGVSVRDITCGWFRATKRNTFDGSRSFHPCCWLSVSVTSFGSDQASPHSPCVASTPSSTHQRLQQM